jgi:hypothetical protein
MLRSQVIKALGLLLLLVFDQGQAASLCESEVAQRLRKGKCSISSMPYRIDGRTVQVDIAAVEAGWELGIDVIVEKIVPLMRLPSGKIVRLKELPSFSRHAEIARAFGFEQFGLDPEMIYEYQALESISGRYCAVYAAKYPFEGRLEDCGSPSRQKNSLGLAPGVISAAQARAAVCAQLKVRDCRGLRSLKLTRKEDGTLIYVVDARVRTGIRWNDPLKFAEQKTYMSNMPIEYEDRTYEMLMDGAISLRSSQRIVCSPVCEPLSVDD